MKRLWPVLFAGLLLVAGGVAVAQPNTQNGIGGAGQRPANLPINPAANRPQPAPPPEAIAALERLRAASARGERIPVPVFDPATGDLKRHADGSLVMNTELPEAQLPASAPCDSAPGGCKVYRGDGSVVDQSQPPPCVATGGCKP